MSQARNYFEALGLVPSFGIDVKDLEKRYFSAQREFHPDRLTGKAAQDRQLAISHSMLLNTAYETLKHPLRRAQYLLTLHGVNITAVKPSAELLMEVMEIREQLTEAVSVESLERIEANNTLAVDETAQAVALAFQHNAIENASECVMRLSYLHKISDEIRAKKKGLVK